MYMVQRSLSRAGVSAGRETVTVKHDGRLVGSASVDYIKWMSDRVPKCQLRSEQKALVDWYNDEEQQSERTSDYASSE
jgi:hypothetical protein